MRKILLSGGALLPATLLLGLATPLLAAEKPGRGLYLENCSACHRPDGVGVKGAFPALAGSQVVLGAKAQVAGRVLNGRGGMPAFKTELTDIQIAQILTYVRSSWGNAAAPVTPIDIAAARNGPPPIAARTLQAH